MRWRTRALVVLAVAALLAMHGLDAHSTAAHASHDASAMASHHDGDDSHDASPSDHGGLHHLAMACVAILFTIGAAIARHRPMRLRAIADSIRSHIAAIASALDAFGRPPADYATCVIRN